MSDHNGLIPLFLSTCFFHHAWIWNMRFVIDILWNILISAKEKATSNDISIKYEIICYIIINIRRIFVNIMIIEDALPVHEKTMKQHDLHRAIFLNSLEKRCWALQPHWLIVPRRQTDISITSHLQLSSTQVIYQSVKSLSLKFAWNSSMFFKPWITNPRVISKSFEWKYMEKWWCG